MIFDDNYSPLSRFDTLERRGTAEPLEPENDIDDGALQDKAKAMPEAPKNSSFADNINSDADYVIESDLVTPKIETIENSKPLIVVVDDDFETLDLLEIYLRRDYEYVPFSGPREAIFYLNQRVPDLIIIDCKIHTMKATTFADIIRSGAGKSDVPFVFMGTEEELDSINSDQVPSYFVGCLKRPVARGDLQGIIDRTIKKK